MPTYLPHRAKPHNRHRLAFDSRRLFRCVLIGLTVGLLSTGWSSAETVAKETSKAAAKKAEPAKAKTVIGATAEVVEQTSGHIYLARIDTGAATCSIHAENVKAVDGVKAEPGSKKMIDNIGKKVAFDLVDEEGNRKRVESKIAKTVLVRTSEGVERRYKVWLTLEHGNVERRIHVTLNDRDKMEYPLLIGRNFLRGHFVVDVEQKKSELELAAKDNAASGESEGDG